MSLTTMRVDTTQAGDVAAARATRTAAEATPRTTFATALTTASAATTSSSAATSETAERKTGAEAAKNVTRAANEKTRPVEGKLYEEIVSGPRKGMFINRSGNARDGEAFVLVEKEGRDVHIYGSGKDRETVVMWHNDDPSAVKVPKGEVSVPVDGEHYEEITDGPRNGMFINRSGNERDGLAFVLVKHKHREDHIYGSGRHTQVIHVWDEGYGPGEAKAADENTPATPQT
jgi:hypothetical protein